MKRRCLRPEDYTIGWICAFPVELGAAIKALDEQHADLPYDLQHGNLYTLGNISGHNVVVVCLPAGQIGTSSATSVLEQTKSIFPKLLCALMVGVGGGAPRPGLHLGDVVVSHPEGGHGGVIQYDLGKKTPNGSVLTGHLNLPSRLLLGAISKIRAKSDELQSCLTENLSSFGDMSYRDQLEDVVFKADYLHQGGTDCKSCDPGKVVSRRPGNSNNITIHYGLIASGNQVVKDGIARDKICSKLGSVLCFEMEAAGLMNLLPTLVVRGVCDWADSHKNKAWQQYAAATAAAFSKHLLSVIPASDSTNIYSAPEKPDVLLGRLRSALRDDLVAQISSDTEPENHDNLQQVPQTSPEDKQCDWVFKNIDFRRWSFAEGSRVLWLSGLDSSQLQTVSTAILDRETKISSSRKKVALVFSFDSNSISQMVVIHSLVRQAISAQTIELGQAMIGRYIDCVLNQFKQNFAIFREYSLSLDTQDNSLLAQILLSAPFVNLWEALASVLCGKDEQDFILLLRGFTSKDTIARFSTGFHVFVPYLDYESAKVKILITGRNPEREALSLVGLIHIDYGKEWKDCLATLRFDNVRRQKIAKEHEGSCNWLWQHPQYREWTSSNSSCLLLIQGKPGSGKSTLTRYFFEALTAKQDVGHESFTVAKFFYSHRDGQLQTSHHSMLLSVLYDILKQDHAFFYHHFQKDYRDLRSKGESIEWPYELLKNVLRSLKDYVLPKPLYLIIDAIDESDLDDRRGTLDLLLELCADAKSTVKIFIASRPVGQLDIRKHHIQHSIILQDETRAAIADYTTSFLHRLNMTHTLERAFEYITQNAQGVFIWVRLIGEALIACAEEGHSEEATLEYLKELPTDLESLYLRMFEELCQNKRNQTDSEKIFQLVLWAKWSLTVGELVHALAVLSDIETRFDVSLAALQRRAPAEQRILHCGGNFIEIKEINKIRTVQIMHQTVREFLLNEERHTVHSRFALRQGRANHAISVICLRYMMIYFANFPAGKSLSAPEDWNSEEVDPYARYLDSWPLIVYTLDYIGQHLWKRNALIDSNLLETLYEINNKIMGTPLELIFGAWLNALIKGGYNGDVWHSDRKRTQQFRRWLHLSTAKARLENMFWILLITGGYNPKEDPAVPPSDPDPKDESGRTALSWAAAYGDSTKTEWVRMETADINARDTLDQTPLMWAARNGHWNTAQILLEKGAQANAPDAQGRTPLSWAAEQGHTEVVDQLLERGAAVNTPDAQGRTPLSWAAEQGRTRAVCELLERGADPNKEDVAMRQPLSWARDNKHHDIYELLRDWTKPLETRMPADTM